MAGFEMSRSTTIDAPPERVHGLIDDFHEWRQWSPWEDVDPDLQRTYTGPDAGVGAHYAWSGNSKAGEGTMANRCQAPPCEPVAPRSARGQVDGSSSRSTIARPGSRSTRRTTSVARGRPGRVTRSSCG